MKKILVLSVICILLLCSNVFAYVPVNVPTNFTISPSLVDDKSLYPINMYNYDTAVPLDTDVMYDIENKNVKFRVDSGFGFWKILHHSVCPMYFSIDLNEFYSTGAKLTIGAYDVENEGLVCDGPSEIDELILINGNEDEDRYGNETEDEDEDISIGYLKGSSRTFSDTMFDIGDVLYSGENRFKLNVDTNKNGWYCGLTYASVEIPFNIGHMESSVEPEIPNSHSVETKQIWLTEFDSEGNVENPSKNYNIKGGLKFGTASSLRKFKYFYEIRTWPELPNWEPRIEYVWKIVTANEVEIDTISEDSGESEEWSGNFLVQLPEYAAPYKLIIDMNLYNDNDNCLIKKIQRTHNLDVIFPSKAISDEQINEYVKNEDQWY